MDKKGNPKNVNELLDILRQASAPQSEPLTEGEREFLLEYTELTEDDLTPQAYEEARLQVAQDQALAEQEAVETALGTRQVSNLIKRDRASVRRSKVLGDVYTLPAGMGTGLLYPRWQFVQGKIVPGLRGILPLFPQYMHPLDIEDFMSSPNEELGNRSPVQWLTTGGKPEVVQALVEELSYE